MIRYSELPKKLQDLVRLRSLEHWNFEVKNFKTLIENDHGITDFFHWEDAKEGGQFWCDIDYGIIPEEYKDKPKNLSGIPKVVEFISFVEASCMVQHPFIDELNTIQIHEGMRWGDYVNYFKPESRPHLEELREAVIDNHIFCNSWKYQRELMACPLFDDGTSVTYSRVAWANLMAAVWSSEDDKDYTTQDFF